MDAMLELSLSVCHGKTHGDEAFMFEPGTGCVPDLVTSYEQARQTEVDPRRPLNRHELLALEMCPACAKDPRFKEYGIRTFPTRFTLALMDKWEAANAAHQVIAEQRKLHVALIADKGFVRQTFSTLMPEGHKQKAPKKGRRFVGTPKPKRDPNAPKVYGECTTIKKAPKKEKEKDKNKKKEK